jgi:hypothetical protein
VATRGMDKVISDMGGATGDVGVACGTVRDADTVSGVGLDVEAMPNAVMDVKATTGTGRDTGATRGATTVSKVPTIEGEWGGAIGRKS